MNKPSYEKLERRAKELENVESERNKTVEALAYSESTLRSIFDSSSLMMGITEVHDNDILHIVDNKSTSRRGICTYIIRGQRYRDD